MFIKRLWKKKNCISENTSFFNCQQGSKDSNVSPLVHHYGADCNISKTMGWIAGNFFIQIYRPQRMNPLVLPWLFLQGFHEVNFISCLVKCLDNCWMDCHEIGYRYSWCPEDDSWWLWWFPDQQAHILFIQTFMVPRGWIIMTLEIPWLFLLTVTLTFVFLVTCLDIDKIKSSRSSKVQHVQSELNTKD